MPERMRFFMGLRAYSRRGSAARGCPPGGEGVFSRSSMKALLDLLYPRECAVCGSRLTEPGRLSFCPGCDAALGWIAPPACARCGAGKRGEACTECEGKEIRFAGATALGTYDGRLRDFVLQLKFRGARYLADEFGRRLAASIPRGPELVVPVPMSRWKLLYRGYNAAGLLAERVAHHAGLRW